MTTKRRTPDAEPVKAAEPQTTSMVHTTPPPPEPRTVADDTLGEYELNGATYLLSAAEAAKRGAKAVTRPANKAITPQNK